MECVLKPTEEIVSQTIPFHSDLHKDVTLWLLKNRGLSNDERITGIKNILLKYEDALTLDLLLHYAAAGFLAQDNLFVQANNLPETIISTMKGSKETSDRLQKNKESARSKKGNDILHEETRQMKADTIEYYKSNREKYKNKDDAASKLADEFVKQSFSTVRKWLRNV